MALVRESFPDREAWLRGRTKGIGGSAAAAAVGLSKYQTNTELWEILTGKREGKPLIGNVAVEFGIRAEPVVRELFKLKHPEYKVEYHQFDILSQSERPFLRATLDAELLADTPVRYGADKGILEIKTATLKTKAQWEEWNGQMPQHYYCQCCHQLLATGWDYVILFALLMGDRDWTVREFFLDRTDAEDDLKWLLNEEETFWGYVERNERPPEKLPLI